MRLAIKSMLIEHAAEVLDVVAEHELAESLVPVPLGIDSAAQAHERAERMLRATTEARAVIDRERRGEAVRPPFRGVLQALRALDDFRLDGAAIPPSPVWDLLDPKSTGRPESAASLVERLADVAMCWDACLADGWTLSSYPVLVALSGAHARAVVVWATLGLPGSIAPVQYPTPRSGDGVRQSAAKGRVYLRGAPVVNGRFGRGQDPSESDISEHASAEFGVHVPIGHVMQLRAEGLRQLHARMAGRGLVPHSERMAAMAVTTTTPWDIEGWKDIATAMGCSVTLAQKLAERDEKPAPVYLALKGVVAVRAELTKWLREEMRPRTEKREP